MNAQYDQPARTTGYQPLNWRSFTEFVQRSLNARECLPLLMFLFLWVASAEIAWASEPLPLKLQQFVTQHCAECHAGDEAEADLQLDPAAKIDWKNVDSQHVWERVHEELYQRRMPPAGQDQPDDESRERLLDWLEGKLIQHSEVGGTLPRRLNRTEYENTIRDLLDWPEFQIPDAFPADDLADGFDNIGEGLILSPPLLAQYLDVATSVADELLPPDLGPVKFETKEYPIGVEGLAPGVGGELVDDHFRVIGSQNMASMAAWPKRFEATLSGVYRLKVSAQPFQSKRQFYDRWDKPFQLSVFSRPKTEQVYSKFEDIRRHTSFSVEANLNEPQEFSCEIELFAGEMFGLRWENGPVHSEPNEREVSDSFYDDRLRRSRCHYAAMLKYKGGPRGTTRSELYEATTKLMDSGELDLDDPRLDELPENYGGGLSELPHAWIKKFVLEELHRYGPAIDVIDVHIEGPLRLIEDDTQRIQKARTKRLLEIAGSPPSSASFVSDFTQRFLSKAFRRTASPEQVSEYVKLFEQHQASQANPRMEDGLHLIVRKALVSPHFLYRSTRTGRMDDFDLASRLSYFLTSAPPDETLLRLAKSQKLSDPSVLKQQTERLLESPRNERFVHNFTSHWLGTRLLRDIMPDPRLLKFFDPDRAAMISEAELFFTEILRENHSMETFIDPGFSYRNNNLNKIYSGDLQGREMQRVTFERGGREGGILSLAAVMMATANGVDTHPVQRGVWLLENVFGSPTPPPPDNVPAIPPNTSGTNTMRAKLNAHRAEESCASCHDKIDPLGMVLENFDPVGRWREHYPIYTKPDAEPLKKEFYASIGEGTAKGPPVDALGRMPDGTQFKNVADLKRYVLQRIDLFSTCLAEKLLTYATGRRLSFGDRREVSKVVAHSKTNGNGFRDLLISLVLSDAFAMK